MWGPALSARHNNWEERWGGHAHSRYNQTAGGGLIGRLCGRTPSPTAGGSQRDPGRFQVGPAVSRRTPVACWIRRSVHPSRPSAMTCCKLFHVFRLKPALKRRIMSNPDANVID